MVILRANADGVSPDFSNILTKKQIEDMATADEFEVVKEVQVSAALLTRLHRSLTSAYQELFADYLPHDPTLYSMTQASIIDGIDDPPNVSPNMFTR